MFKPINKWGKNKIKSSKVAFNIAMSNFNSRIWSTKFMEANFWTEIKWIEDCLLNIIDEIWKLRIIEFLSMKTCWKYFGWHIHSLNKQLCWVSGAKIRNPVNPSHLNASSCFVCKCIIFLSLCYSISF